MSGLETAFGRGLAGDGEGANRHREALERRGAQVAESEQAPEEASRAFGDHHRARFGQGLEAGGEIRGLSDRRLLLRAFADQVPHDQPGRNPNPGRQRCSPPGCGQPRHHRRRRQAGADGPLWLRPRAPHGPAEIGQHTVAHELGHIAAEADDGRVGQEGGRLLAQGRRTGG